MPQITRHVGKLKNTGQKCVIAYRQIPGEPDSAIIIQSDQLPDMFHDNLMVVLKEQQAQQAVELSEVLARRTFANGDNMLNALHSGGFLRKTEVDNVMLYPMPNQGIELRAANDQIGGVESTLSHSPQSAQAVADAEANSVKEALNMLENTPPLEADEIIPVTEVDTAIPVGSNDPIAVASNLLKKAEQLEQEALNLREHAYTVDPDSRPTKGRPKLSDEEKARRREDINAERRKKYKKGTKEDS